MGNCFYRFDPEKYSLIENSGEIMHKIDTNTETINNIKLEMEMCNKNNSENFELIQKDMDKILGCVKTLKQEINYILSHQSSSRYGGLLPDIEQDSLDGPSDTMFSTSE